MRLPEVKRDVTGFARRRGQAQRNGDCLNLLSCACALASESFVRWVQPAGKHHRAGGLHPPYSYATVAARSMNCRPWPHPVGRIGPIGWICPIQRGTSAGRLPRCRASSSRHTPCAVAVLTWIGARARPEWERSGRHTECACYDRRSGEVSGGAFSLPRLGRCAPLITLLLLVPLGEVGAEKLFDVGHLRVPHKLGAEQPGDLALPQRVGKPVLDLHRQLRLRVDPHRIS